MSDVAIFGRRIIPGDQPIKAGPGGELFIARKDRVFRAKNAATDATGTPLSYSPPAGKTAIVISVSVFHNAGAPTIQLQHVRGGTAVIIRSDTTSYRESTPIALEAGDTLRLQVTAAGAAGSNADLTISAEELM